MAGLLFIGSTIHIPNLPGSRLCDRMVFSCQWRFGEFSDTVWYTIDKKGWHWTRKGKIRESKWGGWQWNMERRSKQWPAAFRPEWKGTQACKCVLYHLQRCSSILPTVHVNLMRSSAHTHAYTLFSIHTFGKIKVVVGIHYLNSLPARLHTTSTWSTWVKVTCKRCMKRKWCVMLHLNPL